MTEPQALILTGALKEYLEAIYTLSRQQASVRTTDIALKLGISKPSVHRAVNSLKNAGLVFHKPYGDIVLTPSGMLYGKQVYSRHTQIKRFLISVLNISGEDADKEALLIEHNLSQNTVDRMVSYMDEAKPDEDCGSQAV